MRVYQAEARENDVVGKARLDVEWRSAPPQFGAQMTFDFEAVEEGITKASISPVESPAPVDATPDAVRGEAGYEAYFGVRAL